MVTVYEGCRAACLLSLCTQVMSSFWIEPLDEPVMPELRGDVRGTDGYNSRLAFAL